MGEQSRPAAPDTGSAPSHQGSAELLRRLDTLGIAHRTLEHAAVFTVEEAKALRGNLTGAHSKNLFLRDKKGAMWLLSCLADKTIDLRKLGEKLGARSLSFASRTRLTRYLGVIPGAVTPFAIINDPDAAVSVVLDRDLLTYKQLNFHPLDNTRTTTITADDLLRFLRALNHEPRLLDL